MCCTKKRQTQKGPAAKEEAEEANADGTFTYPDSNSPVAKVKKSPPDEDLASRVAEKEAHNSWRNWLFSLRVRINHSGANVK